MQILFINILMDGTFLLQPHVNWATYRSIGPPSQSLGVDPVDPTVMRRPPRRKDAPIISRRLLYRVIFSASIIVVETLFIYIYALSDDRMSRREQTMVRGSSSIHLLQQGLTSVPDIYVFRVPRPRFRDSEPRSGLRNHPKQDACPDGFGLFPCPVELDLRSPHADDLPDGPIGLWGSVAIIDLGRCFFHFARG